MPSPYVPDLSDILIGNGLSTVAAQAIEDAIAAGGGGSGGVVDTTPAALIALRRAGTLVPATTYRTPEGYTYRARSTTNFVPAGHGPVITGGSMTSMGDSFNANGVVNSNRIATTSIFGWAATQLLEPLEVVAFRAVAGQSWATINSGQLAAALADPSEVVHITCGPNVWLQVATSTTVDQAIADATVVLDALSAAKQLVIVSNSGPGKSASHPRMYDLLLYNLKFSALCSRYPNVKLFDVYGSMVDTTNANGDVLNAYTGDNLLHPNMRGAMRCGVACARALNNVRLMGRTATLVNKTDFSTTGGTKSGGTQTGTIPTGLRSNVSSGSANVTFTQINQGTAASADNQVNMSITNAAGTVTRVDIDTGNTTAFNGSFVAGDIVRGWITVRFKNMVSLDGFYAYLTITGGGGTNTFAFSPALTVTDANPLPEMPYEAKLWMPPQTLTGAISTLNLGFGIQLKADVNAVASVDFSGFVLEKVSAA